MTIYTSSNIHHCKYKLEPTVVWTVVSSFSFPLLWTKIWNFSNFRLHPYICPNLLFISFVSNLFYIALWFFFLLQTHIIEKNQGWKTLDLVELHEICISLCLKTVKVHLDGTVTLQGVNCMTQLCVTCRIPEGALSFLVHVINKDVQQGQFQYKPLRRNAPHWSLFE